MTAPHCVDVLNSINKTFHQLSDSIHAILFISHIFCVLGGLIKKKDMLVCDDFPMVE